MNNEGSIFEEYARERTLKERMKQPKFWVKYILAIFFIIFAVMIYKAMKSSWSENDVKNSMEIVYYKTGWVEGKSELREKMTRILPYISFKVKNIGKAPLQYVNFESVFLFQINGETQTSGFYAAFNDPLDQGEISSDIILRGVNGYTASSKDAFYKNKDKWRKVNAKIFARTKGSPPVRIGDIYPVEQKIEGFTGDLALEPESELLDSVNLIVAETGWIYRKMEGKSVIVYPSITFKIENKGEENLEKLAFKAIFIFEKHGERFHFGYPVIKGVIKPGTKSDEIMIRAESGISAASLQSLYNNIFNWENVRVKIYIKDMTNDFAPLGEFNIKKEVKGVKIINESPK